MDEVTGLLDGFRALDLTDEKGFLCGRILGDLGVNVIKVEPPGGDPARSVGLFFHDTSDPEKSLLWFAYNANKRRITLNIERVKGQELFKGLVKTAEKFPHPVLPLSAVDGTKPLGFHPKEIYPGITGHDPEWCVYREFYCPGCCTQLEVEAVPHGMPFIFSTELELD